MEKKMYVGVVILGIAMLLLGLWGTWHMAVQHYISLIRNITNIRGTFLQGFSYIMALLVYFICCIHS